MERDFIGYGNTPPQARWPQGARVALSLVINWEEGSEHSLAFGDDTQEAYKEYPKVLPEGVRDLANESVYEYGTRVGVWRLLRILAKHDVPCTFFACAMALERNRPAAKAAVEAGHEMCSHGYRWEEPFTMSEAEERENIAKAVASMRETTGVRPDGWYCRYGPSLHTRRLLAEEGGFVYDSDSYADELPYYVTVSGQPRLVLPYSLEVNDMKFWANGTFGNGEDFFRYMKDSLDLLVEEGAQTPRMMSVGLHLRIAGRPGRAHGVDRFIAYAKSLGNVWFARRIDIARLWLEQHPPSGG